MRDSQHPLLAKAYREAMGYRPQLEQRNMQNAPAAGGGVGPGNRAAPAVFNPRETGSDYFWYTHTPIQTLANATPTATAFINLDADSEFYCVALTYAASIADAALTESTNVLPLVYVQITDTGSGKSLMNAPVALYSLMGDGKRPYRLVRPRTFQPNGTIQLAFTAFVAAGTTYSDLAVTFHGYKVYR